MQPGPFLLVGVGEVGGKVLAEIRAELARELARIGWEGAWPDAWQLLHVDFGSAAESLSAATEPGTSVNQITLPVPDPIGQTLADFSSDGNIPLADDHLATAAWVSIENPKLTVPGTHGSPNARALGRLAVVRSLRPFVEQVDTSYQAAAATDWFTLGRLAELLGESTDAYGEPTEPLVLVLGDVTEGMTSGGLLDICDVVRSRATGGGTVSMVALVSPAGPRADGTGADASALNAFLAGCETLNAGWSEASEGGSLHWFMRRAGLPPARGGRGPLSVYWVSSLGHDSRGSWCDFLAERLAAMVRTWNGRWIFIRSENHPLVQRGRFADHRASPLDWPVSPVFLSLDPHLQGDIPDKFGDYDSNPPLQEVVTLAEAAIAEGGLANALSRPLAEWLPLSSGWQLAFTRSVIVRRLLGRIRISASDAGRRPTIEVLNRVDGEESWISLPDAGAWPMTWDNLIGNVLLSYAPSALQVYRLEDESALAPYGATGDDIDWQMERWLVEGEGLVPDGAPLLRDASDEVSRKALAVEVLSNLEAKYLAGGLVPLDSGLSVDLHQEFPGIQAAGLAAAAARGIRERVEASAYFDFEGKA